MSQMYKIPGLITLYDRPKRNLSWTEVVCCCSVRSPKTIFLFFIVLFLSVILKGLHISRNNTTWKTKIHRFTPFRSNRVNGKRILEDKKRLIMFSKLIRTDYNLRTLKVLF